MDSKHVSRSLLVCFIVLVLLFIEPINTYAPGEISPVEALQHEGLKFIAENAKAAPQAVTLFEDDFESGLSKWNLDSDWSILVEGSNQVLLGEGHAWSSALGGESWGDYILTGRFKILDGAVHFNVRMGDLRGRYFIGVTPGGAYLRRESPWSVFSDDLAAYSGSISTYTWHTIEIQMSLGHTTVYIDDILRLSRKDYFPLTLWQGTIGLEVVGSETAEAYFDDIHVVGVPVPEGSWKKTGGPIGGLGYDVRYGETSDILFVTDNYSGINKSTDGGETWFPSNRGITGRFGTAMDAIPVFATTVDPNNPDIIWAGLKEVNGVYKSVNAGVTWEEVTPEMEEDEVVVFRGFTIQPGNSNIVYAQGEIPTGVNGKVFDRVRGRIYRTDNGGETWTKIWEGANLVRYVIIHPENQDVLYASLGIFDREADDSSCAAVPPVHGTGGVLKLINTGSSWDQSLQGVDEGLNDLYVGSLVMHPSNPDIMLAAVGNNACSPYTIDSTYYNTGGVYITYDGGDHWQQTNISGEVMTSVEFAPSNPNIAYAGGQNHFYVSRNGGASWGMVAGQTFPWGPPGVSAGFPIDILVDLSDPEVLFVNNYGGGNVMSENAGLDWKLSSEGYTGALMLGIAMDPYKPSTVYAGARSGAFRSTTGGRLWQGVAVPPANLFTAYTMAVKPGEPNVVLGAHELSGLLYRSEDGANSWTEVLDLPGTVPGDVNTEFGIRRIAFAPGRFHETVYAGSCRGFNRLENGFTDGMGVWKSTNGGVSWDTANDATIQDECITGLAIHPSDPDIVFATTAASSLFVTFHGGDSWFPVAGLPNALTSIAINPSDPNIMYVGAKSSGIFLSEDGGVTWDQRTCLAGMEPNDSIRAIVFDPVDPSIVWAASYVSGIYRWLPDEFRWTHINDGLEMRAVTDLTISADGSVLYAATMGNGVYRFGDTAEWFIYLPAVLNP